MQLQFEACFIFIYRPYIKIFSRSIVININPLISIIINPYSQTWHKFTKRLSCNVRELTKFSQLAVWTIRKKFFVLQITCTTHSRAKISCNFLTKQILFFKKERTRAFKTEYLIKGT